MITRPFAGEGVRVTIGTPEEDDVLLDALDDVLSSAEATVSEHRSERQRARSGASAEPRDDTAVPAAGA